MPTGFVADESKWTYYSADGSWSPDPNALAPVSDNATNSVIQVGGSFRMFVMNGQDRTNPDPNFWRTIRVYAAGSPWGPWATNGAPSASCVVEDDPDLGLVGRPPGGGVEPDPGNDYSKQAIAHPEISTASTSKVLVSYANTVAPSPDVGRGLGDRLRFTLLDLNAVGAVCAPDPMP